MSNKLQMALAALLFAILCWFCLGRHGAEMNAAVPAPAATAALAAPAFQAIIDDGKVRLTGTLPNEAAKAAVIARARELYGDTGYLDELRVGNVANPAWVASVPGWLPPLQLKTRPTGGLSIDGAGRVDLTGQVATHEIRSGIYNDVRKSVPANWAVNDLMVVNAGPALSDKGLEAQTEINKFLIGKIIEFDTGKATIRPAGQQILDEAATLLKKYDIPFEVSGHTDNVGNPGSNLKLSQARSAAVKTYLAGKGVAGTRITTSGAGDTKPIGDNTTEDGRQRNRRIEFAIRETIVPPAPAAPGK
ncbi:MAG: OmpA family protein [Blastocatellia bacterium]